MTHTVHPRVRIVPTKGDLYLTLYPEWAPLTVRTHNVADHGYFDNNRWFGSFRLRRADRRPDRQRRRDAGYSIGAEENPLEQAPASSRWA